VFKFIWEGYVGIDGTVPEKRRRITVKRLRKEYSEGLLMPVTDFAVDKVYQPSDTFAVAQTGGYLNFKEGDDVAALIGVTHYVPEFDRENTASFALSLKDAYAPKSRYPKTLKGWFFWTLYKLGLTGAGRSLALETSFRFPEYDVDALKNNKRLIQAGDLVHVSEKIHGSNARYVFADGEFYAGSRTQWKQKGANVWWTAAQQHPEIEEWCRANPGLVLYGEVGPTQKGYRYGCGDGETFFFAFDVYDPKADAWYWSGTMGFPTNAPNIYSGVFSAEVLKYADGKSQVVGANHIREGVVIRKIGSQVKLKVVSNAFLEHDGKY
jgi:hypothetical protein